MKAIMWALAKLKKEKYTVIALCVVNMLISLCVIAFALMTKRVIDTATNHLQSTLLIEGGFLFALIFIRIILGIINNRLQVMATAKITIKLQRNLFESLLSKKYQKVSQIHSGDILNRLTSDVDILTNAFVTIPINAVSMATKIIAGTISMIILDPTFTIAIVIIGVVVFIISRFFGAKFKNIHKACQKIGGEIRSFINETIQNIAVVKSFNGSKKITDKLDKEYDKSIKLQLKKNVIGTISTMGTYSIFTTSYYVALCIGALKLQSGSVTVGTLMGFLQLINQVQTPFRSMSGIFPQYYAGIASAERLQELENIENDEQLDTKVSDFSKIEIKNVGFFYGEDNVGDKDYIIKNANFNIEKGDFICLMGNSGIGKSTIIKLLLSFEKIKSGNILVDDVCLTVAHRSLFAYVPQGNLILSGTILENIVFFSDNKSKAEIDTALKVCDAYDFVYNLPNGLNTVIGEKGFGLSEGQIQRISLARAVLYNAEIFLLDEATSAMDIQTEKTILKNLKALDKTIFFVTHKKNALEFCNKVYTIKNKKIVEDELV